MSNPSEAINKIFLLFFKHFECQYVPLRCLQPLATSLHHGIRGSRTAVQGPQDPSRSGGVELPSSLSLRHHLTHQILLVSRWLVMPLSLFAKRLQPFVIEVQENGKLRTLQRPLTLADVTKCLKEFFLSLIPIYEFRSNFSFVPLLPSQQDLGGKFRKLAAVYIET